MKKHTIKKLFLAFSAFIMLFYSVFVYCPIPVHAESVTVTINVYNSAGLSLEENSVTIYLVDVSSSTYPWPSSVTQIHTNYKYPNGGVWPWSFTYQVSPDTPYRMRVCSDRGGSTSQDLFFTCAELSFSRGAADDNSPEFVQNYGGVPTIINIYLTEKFQDWDTRWCSFIFSDSSPTLEPVTPTPTPTPTSTPAPTPQVATPTPESEASAIPFPTSTSYPQASPLTSDTDFWERMGQNANGAWGVITSTVSGIFSNVVMRNLAIYIPLFGLIIGLIIYTITLGGGDDN